MLRLFASLELPVRSTMSTNLVLVALAAFTVSGSIRAQTSSALPAQYIDHIMIRTDDPAALFAFFTDTLELPIAWPFADRNGVVSGGVGFGNVNVEAIAFPNQIDEPAPTRVVGLALKPVSLEQSLAELSRRGVAFNAPRPFTTVGPNGARILSFTNVTLSELSDADLPGQATIQVFLSEYDPAYVDAVARRDRLRGELSARRGGPLGLVRVREVVIGTADLRAANRNWERLAVRVPTSEGSLWQIGDGPAVRLVEADETSIDRLVLTVASLPKARDFLRRAGIIGADADTELAILPAKIRGLDIRVVGESTSSN